MVPYGSMPRPARPPFVGPAASSGIPATATGVAAEVEQNRTKPQKSARTTPAGSKKEKTPKTAKQDGPSSSTKKVKRPYSEKTAAQTGLLKPEQPEKKSKVEAVPKLAVEAEPEPESEPIINRDDPGGRIVWAKVANYPWWPAKTLDPAKDRSFPRNADRPRPNAIPVRFFGTHDFGWLGSKRALEEWEEGKQKSRIEECDQASFKEAVKEAEVYLEQKTLPDAFYMSPRLESGKRGKSSTTSRKRSSSGGHGKKALIIKDPIQRRAMIMERKKRRLLDWGLLPPPQSPYGLLNGRVAPNQQLLDVCRKHWDGVVSMKDITLHEPRPFRGMMDMRTTKNEDTTEKSVTIGINDIDKPVADIHKEEPTPIENGNIEQKVDP